MPRQRFVNITTNVPIRILVDAHAMGQQLGRTVIVENHPGASGNLAAEAVACALSWQTLHVGAKS